MLWELTPSWLAGSPTRPVGRELLGAVQIAYQGDLGAAVQNFLLDPPPDVDERLVRVRGVACYGSSSCRRSLSRTGAPTMFGPPAGPLVMDRRFWTCLSAGDAGVYAS